MDDSWIMIRVTVPVGARDAVAGHLVDMGSLGLVEEAWGLAAWFRDMGNPSQIVHRVGAVMDRLGREGLDTAGARVEAERVPNEDWQRSWKATLKPLRLACGLVIAPDGAVLRHDEPDVVTIDPGMAFGSGHHETTGRCACLIRDHGPTVRGLADRFLDAGTGTGILAIVAARTGFRDVTGVDPDPAALRTARRNLERNGLEKRVRLLEVTVDDAPPGPYGMIAANLLASLLDRAAPHLGQAVVPGGLLIASGLLAGQDGPLSDSLEGHGFRCRERYADGRWVTLLMERG